MEQMKRANKAEIVNVIIWDGFCGNCFWYLFKVTLSWKNKWNDWHWGFDWQVHCVNEVEARGLNEVGIYRVPG